MKNNHLFIIKLCMNYHRFCIVEYCRGVEVVAEVAQMGIIWGV
jgi:hypothetical protein